MSITSKEIKELRISRGESQQKFANVIGVSLWTVFRWEHDIVKPSPLALEKLEKIKRGGDVIANT